MLVPHYWAESRGKQTVQNREVALRRFGWSDVSEADAKAKADLRLKEAITRLLVGEKIDRIEAKTHYNGAHGVPIREEIVSTHGETIITRNAYGALCLNTPHVLFADIDDKKHPDFFWSIGFVADLINLVVAIVLFSGFTCIGWLFRGVFPDRAILISAMLLPMILWLFLYRPVRALTYKSMGGKDAINKKRIAKFIRCYPDWKLRLYKTPAGMRVMVTHTPFDPHDPMVTAFFDALQGDPIYKRMCLNQQCFRARVSPKPWRIGIGEHITPRTVWAWPLAADKKMARDRWITTYETAAKAFAACRFLEEYGNGKTHPEIYPVLKLHDNLCQAEAGLPIA